MKLFTATSASLLAAVITPFVLVVFIVTAAGGDGRLANAGCATDANLAPILATIRSLESGGDYSAEAAGSTASGAYQFIDGTWNDFGGYGRAVDAPPAVQDQKASEMVRSVLADHENQVGVVPVIWYIGQLPDEGSSEWDTVPVPDAGNVLTPREYRERWLKEYEVQSTDADTLNCVSGVGTFGELPPSLDCSTIAWGGYANGRIPSSAMRYRPHSGSLHPHASATFDELFAAAQAAGPDLSGYGYRPASAGGATSGSSCHGLGLAVDITILVVGRGHRYATADAAFAGAEFTWLCNNAHHFGWITPRWAIPAGMVCGSVVGTGRGGHVGDDCCFLEPWHIEAAGSLPFLASPPPSDPLPRR